MKPFLSIPGPKSWPLLGGLPNYTIGKKYDFLRLSQNGLKKYREFGPIVREEIVPGVTIVWLFDPQDIKTMFGAEGRYPSRRSHLALEKYRRDRPEVYNNGGLLPTNGSEWSRLRVAAQKPLTMKLLSSHIPAIDQVSRDFVEMLRSKNMAVHKTLDEELKKYFLEITGVVVLGTRLGAITKELKQDSKAYRLMEAALGTNRNILKTDNALPLWKYFETKAYREIRMSQVRQVVFIQSFKLLSDF